MLYILLYVPTRYGKIRPKSIVDTPEKQVCARL